MGKKGEETREYIKHQAYQQFAAKGFKEVTMKDICQATGLSRGGLYRHFESTEQIFVEILAGFLEDQNENFNEQIEKGISAVIILDNILEKYKAEMLDARGSLSMAIYEYFGSKEMAEHENLLAKQYVSSFDSWNILIQYGIARHEFQQVDTRSIFDLIVFSYQGVRLYSQLMDIQADIPERIIKQIKYLLLSKEGR